MKNLLGIYEKALPSALSWPQRLEEAKAAGFDFLEISIDESDERLERLKWSSSLRRELRHACEEICMPLDSMCLSGQIRVHDFFQIWKNVQRWLLPTESSLPWKRWKHLFAILSKRQWTL